MAGLVMDPHVMTADYMFLGIEASIAPVRVATERCWKCMAELFGCVGGDNAECM